MLPVIIGPIAEVVNTVLKRVLPAEKMSEAELAQIQLELTKADWAGVLAQANINLEEAKHESRFVAGWRPFVGWVCGAAFAFHFLLIPILMFARAYGGWILPSIPVFDMDSLMTVLIGMLGLGGLRTFEKFKGVNKSR